MPNSTPWFRNACCRRRRFLFHCQPAAVRNINYCPGHAIGDALLVATKGPHCGQVDFPRRVDAALVENPAGHSRYRRHLERGLGPGDHRKQPASSSPSQAVGMHRRRSPDRQSLRKALPLDFPMARTTIAAAPACVSHKVRVLAVLTAIVYCT